MDDRQYAPATQRNRQGILKILSEVLPPGSTVLEIASGTGEHATFFASQLESCHWIPSDVNAQARESIIAWQNACPVENLELPLLIDVIQDNWQQEVLHRQGAVPRMNSGGRVLGKNLLSQKPTEACTPRAKSRQPIAVSVKATNGLTVHLSR